MEIWNLYTAERQPTGRTMVRGDKHPEGCYNIGVYVWIRNPDGKYLISQRAACKASYPLCWETVGGCVTAGETSLEGAVREVHEEVGIVVDASRLKLICSLFEPQWNGRTLQEIDDVYLYEMDEEYEAVNAKSDEVAQSRWMTREEIRQLFDQGELVDALAYFFTEIDVEEM